MNLENYCESLHIEFVQIICFICIHCIYCDNIMHVVSFIILFIQNISQMGIVDTDLWFFAVQFIGYNILGTGVVCL